MNNEEHNGILTLEEAAQYLRVTPDELLKELQNGTIPALKLAGKWRIKKTVLDKLLEGLSGGSEPGAPPTNGAAVLTSEPANPMADTEAPASPPSVPDVTPAEPAEAPAPMRVIDEPRAGFTRGRVFVYNARQGYGWARLPDNRVVWLDATRLVERLPTPTAGDYVEFELRRTKKGWEAFTIYLITAEEWNRRNAAAVPPPRAEVVEAALPRPAAEGKAPPAAKPTAAAEKPADRQTLGVDAVTRSRITAKSRQLYQKAALARTEGRYDEARSLFRQAIEAGADMDVYSAFFKMEQERSNLRDAQRIIQQAIEKFPTQSVLYEMYGQMERRARHFKQAEKIFRQGLSYAPKHVSLRWGLGQTLVQLGTENSLREAGELFEQLDREGKLHRHDGLYQRFKALQQSPRANRAYDFFGMAGMKVGVAGRRELPPHITDIVMETTNQELMESFGLSGAFLVRCFQRQPSQIDIVNLSKYLRSLGQQGQQGVIGLTDREVVINPSLAFIAVPNSDAVRDQVMSLASENNEAIVPLDDLLFQSSEVPQKDLRDVLGTYLGMRDLYSSTLPVYGRRFFGREKLLRKLTDEVHRGQFIGIYGLRKMGKTSLIYQLRDEKLNDEAVAYVDLLSSHALAARKILPLYWELERDLYQRLQKSNAELAELLRLGKVEFYSDLAVKEEDLPVIFSEDVRKLLELIREGRTGKIKHLIIVLDELEKILPVGSSPGIDGYIEFFGLLRGLAQTERYRGLLCSVVVAANASISERGFWNGRENPVFALYKPEFLPPLENEECEKMIRTLGKGMSVYWTDEAIAAVFAETGGHPFLTRLFCSRMTKAYPVRPLEVTLEMVNAQIPLFIRDESAPLEQITELLRTHFPDEGRLLEQIALDESPVDLDDEAIRHLNGYKLIQYDGQSYQVALNLLRRWLRRRAGVRE